MQPSLPFCGLSIKNERENEGVHIAFDVIDKDEIYLKFQTKIKGAIAALCLVSGNIKGAEKVSDGILIYKNDGSIIYPFIMKGGIATAYVSSPLTNSSIEKIGVLFSRLSQYKDLERVVKLFVSSLNSKYRFA